jgi:hypothetical protein
VICSLRLDGALGVDLELDWPLPEGENRVNMVLDLCLLVFTQSDHLKQ